MKLTRVFLAKILFDSAGEIWGALQKRVSPWFFLPPLVFRIRLTNRCNLSCHYCYVSESLNKKNPGDLSLQEWERIIDQIPWYSIVDLTGGEPFLAPHFLEIINRLLDRNLKVSLITNGTVNKEDVLETLVVKKLRYFMVSIDGERDQHDKIRGAGSFDKSINTIKKIQKLKEKYGSSLPSIVCKVTLTDTNSGSLEQLSDYLLNDVQVNGITFNLLFQNNARNGIVDAEDFYHDKFWSGNTASYGDNSPAKIHESLERIVRLFKGRITVRPEIKKQAWQGYMQKPSRFSPVNCSKYLSIVTMYQDGKLTPCDLSLDIGNIKDVDYNPGKVFQLQRFTKFKSLFEKHQRSIPGCAGCCLKTHECLNEKTT